MQRQRGSHVIFNYAPLMFAWAADFWCSTSMDLLWLSSAHLRLPTHLPLSMCVRVLKSSYCIRKSSLSGLWLNMLKKHWCDTAWPSCGTEALSTPNGIIKHIIICTGILKWLMMKAERKAVGGRRNVPVRYEQNSFLIWFERQSFLERSNGLMRIWVWGY